MLGVPGVLRLAMALGVVLQDVVDPASLVEGGDNDPLQQLHNAQ